MLARCCSRTEYGRLEAITGGDVTAGKMILLFDIGNTHTHIGLADERRVVKQTNIPTLTGSGDEPAG